MLQDYSHAQAHAHLHPGRQVPDPRVAESCQALVRNCSLGAGSARTGGQRAAYAPPGARVLPLAQFIGRSDLVIAVGAMARCCTPQV